MPTLLTAYADPRFYARFPIEGLAMLAGGDLLTLCRADQVTLLQRFDATTGHLVEELAIPQATPLSGHALIQADPGTGELVCCLADPYARPLPLGVWQVGRADGSLTANRLDSFTTESYHPRARLAALGLYVATAERLRLVDPATQAEHANWPAPVAADNNGQLAISPDGRLAAFADSRGLRIVVLATATGQLVRELQADELTRPGAQLLFSPDGRWLLAAGKRMLECWEVTSGERTWGLTAPGPGSDSYLLAFSPDGRHLAVSSIGWGLRVHDARTGDGRWQAEPVEALCFSADGNRLYTAPGFPLHGHRVAAYNALTGAPQPGGIGLTDPQVGRLFATRHPGQLLATGHHDYRAYLLDATTGVQLGDFKPDTPLSYWGTRYPAVTQELLDYLDTLNPRRLPSRWWKVRAFFGDGQRVAAGGDKFMGVWDGATRRQLWQVPTLRLVWADMAITDDQTQVLAWSTELVLVCFAVADGTRQWEFRARKGRKGPGWAMLHLVGVFGRAGQVLCLFNTGELLSLDAATGSIRHSTRLAHGDATASLLLPDNRLLVVHLDGTVAQYDVQDWLGACPAARAAALAALHPPVAAPFQLPLSGLPATGLAEALAAASWAGFDWERDAPGLLARLHEAEAQHGVGEAHHLCTARLQALSAAAREPFFALRHPYGWRTELVSVALSPDGRYLATGRELDNTATERDWYDEGGEVQVWDVASGHCVNKFPGVVGGVGWSGFTRCLQWSPDGTRLGLSYCTNNVGVLDPFADRLRISPSFDETNGMDRPKPWCWHPAGAALFLSCWREDQAPPGVVLPVVSGTLPLNRPYGFFPPADWSVFSQQEVLDRGGQPDATSAVANFRQPGWSTRGYVYGTDDKYAYTLDPRTRRIGAVIRDVPAGRWSPDGRYLCERRGEEGEELAVYDASGALLRTVPLLADVTAWLQGPGRPAAATVTLETEDDGSTTLLLDDWPVLAPDHYRWHPDADQQLLVAWSDTDYGYGYVAFYRDFQLVGLASTYPMPNAGFTKSDTFEVALAPDGRRAATLGRTGDVTLWDLTDGVRELRTFPTAEAVGGILLGADEQVVGVGSHALYFYDGRTGTLRNHYDPQAADHATPPPGRPPLPPAPAAREPRFEWPHDGALHQVAAYPTGLVVAPPALRPALTVELSFVVGNHYAWPYRWTLPREADSLADAQARGVPELAGVPLPA